MLWSECTLSELMNIQTGASFGKDEAITQRKDNYVRVLRGGNVSPFYYSLKGDDLYIPKALITKDIFLKRNDLITPAVTSLENIGKIAVIDRDLPDVVVGGFVYTLRPFISDYYLSMILMYFMSSPVFLSEMISITKKSGQAFYNMNKEKLKGLVIQIPQAEEMKKIVIKINSLFETINLN